MEQGHEVRDSGSVRPQLIQRLEVAMFEAGHSDRYHVGRGHAAPAG